MKTLIQKLLSVMKNHRLLMLVAVCAVLISIGVGVTGYQSGYQSGQQDYKEQSYSEGYSYGRDAGYKDGYLNGQKEGNTTGHDEGYETGHEEGYNAAHDEGYTAGYNEGYQTGKDEGYTAGSAAGQAASISNETVSASANTDTGGGKTVYVTRTGECYHSADCSYLNNKTGVRTMTESEAIAEGYRACSRCGG